MTSPVRTFDLVRNLAAAREEILQCIGRVLDSGTIILGPETEAFESEFAAMSGVEYAIGVASGTDALILGLRACGVQSGDEVITVANTAVPTASAIRAIGAIPVFADVSDDTLLMDPVQVESLITPRTRVLLPVHLYGQIARMQELQAIAERNHLRILEDCAHAHGATLDGQHAGTFGDVGCFSFYPTKNIGALGDAGLCITNRPELASRIRELRMYGFDRHRIALCDGLNSRLDEIQAAILRVRLRHFAGNQQRRHAIARRYSERLQGLPVTLPVPDERRQHAWHQFVIRSQNRSALIESFRRNEIGWGIHYEYCLHRMPAFAGFFDQTKSLPITEKAACEILSLPVSPELTDEECDRVILALQEALL
jgi:dTDP-4-amino-4,6-dideoxygalactose transaminase